MWQGDQKMRADLEQILNSSLPLVLEYDGTYDKVDISDLEEPCRRGIPAAIGELAARFRIGVDGAEKNPSKAFKLYQEVLKYQRNAWALRCMGVICEEGGLGEENQNDCIEYYEAASKLGSGHSSTCLGIVYAEGKYIAKDTEKAKEYFLLAIQQGYTYAYYDLGISYSDLGQYDKAKMCYEKVVKEEPKAYIMLGNMYEEGLGVPKDGQKALGMYRLAYKNGIQGEGACSQGKLYYYGELVEEDDRKALELFQEALKYGDNSANYYIGTIYGIGIKGYLEPNIDQALKYLSEVPEDFIVRAETTKGKLLFYAGRIKEAQEVLEKATAEGSEDAQEFLQEKFQKESEKNTSVDLRQLSAQELQILYEQGNIDAAFFLGTCYKIGRNGVQQDAAKAIRLFEEVIQSGGGRESYGYTEIAEIYKYGYGVPVDYSKAFKYASIASEGGNATAKLILADMYKNGEGMHQNDEKAFQLFKEAADNNGNVVAFREVAQALFMARGVTQNVPEGCRYLLKYYKFNPEDRWANYMMGQFYQIGVHENGEELIPVNADAAIKCLLKVGDGSALTKLGEMYEEGKGVPINMNEAVRYYEMAQQKGDLDAISKVAIFNLLPDMQNENWYNPEKGIQAAKIFLDQSSNSTLKELIIYAVEEYLKRITQISGYQQNILQEYEYLLDKIGNIGLTYSDEESKERIRTILGQLIVALSAYYLNLYENNMQLCLHKIESMLKKMDNCGERNKYIKDGAREETAEQYLQLGKVYLEFDLQKAQEMFQNAAWHGSGEAEGFLKRFRTNLFGKLIFK